MADIVNNPNDPNNKNNGDGTQDPINVGGAGGSTGGVAPAGIGGNTPGTQEYQVTHPDQAGAGVQSFNNTQNSVSANPTQSYNSIDSYLQNQNNNVGTLMNTAYSNFLTSAGSAPTYDQSTFNSAINNSCISNAEYPIPHHNCPKIG